MLPCLPFWCWRDALKKQRSLLHSRKAQLQIRSKARCRQNRRRKCPRLTEESTSARKAYAAALKTLLDTNVLPDGTDFSDGYIGSIQDRERMAENKFTVYDVDGDGREELVLLYAAAPAMAGMAGFVYDYDAQKQALRSQLTEFPALTFYENGAVKADWSHNQGKAGDGFWPYNLYLYDQETDSYQEAASVDAWDRETFPEEYPSTADTSGTGPGLLHLPGSGGGVGSNRPGG